MNVKKTLPAVALLFAAGAGMAQEYVDFVDPLMGTASTFEFSHGNTYPATARPWGVNFWSPQTGANGSGWMYTYADSVICGFRQTHQPSPWINDYGTFSVMPVSGELKIPACERGVPFRHENEKASPESYEVILENGVKTALTATRTGMIMEVAYPSAAGQYFVIDAMRGGCRIEIDQINRRVTGYVKNNHGGVPDNFANYFIMEFSHPVAEKGVMVNDSVMPGKMVGEHDRVCAYLRFLVPPGDRLTVRAASSFISPRQAELNFNREVAGRTFAETRLEARAEWNGLLGRIEVGGGTPEQQKTFYSCLYRTLLFPRELYEFDADSVPVYYSPYDGGIHEGYMYTDNGFWDTFRAVHPLFTLLYPEVTGRVVSSLLNAYDESGFMPEWASPGHRNCMIGNNSLSLITDAYAKGIRNFDTEKALKAMINQVEAQGPVTSSGRNGSKEYFEKGYLPYPDYPEATAKTLEYAYADWCLSQFASATGNADIADEYGITAYNYRNLFDARYGFMRARNRDGEWIEPFLPEEWGGPFTEGSSWHYTWSVMHDVEGLARLMEGVANLKRVAPVDGEGSVGMDYVDGLRRKCYEAMNDDLNSPIVISHLFDACRVINTIIDKKATIGREALEALSGVFRTFAFDILGLKEEAGDGSAREEAFGQVVDMLLEQRMAAKANKDWATSDKIRDRLAALGFEVKDTKDGFTWRLDK